MINKNQVNYIIDRVSRLYGVQLPLEFENYEYNNSSNKLIINFKSNEKERSFEVNKFVKIDFDKDSNIITGEICEIERFLPKTD